MSWVVWRIIFFLLGAVFILLSFLLSPASAALRHG